MKIIGQEYTEYWCLRLTNQDDRRPVVICRYKETAIGFARLYDELGLPYIIAPIKLKTADIEVV